MTHPPSVRPAIPLTIRVFLMLVVLELILRAFIPPEDMSSHFSLGCQVLIAGGLLRRSEVARVASLLLAGLSMLRNLPRMFVLSLLATDTNVSDTAMVLLIDAVVNVAFAMFVLVMFDRPDVKLWTASPPRKEPVGTE